MTPGPKANAMPVAIYCRVSTEEQREKQSIATQMDFAKRYCELHQLRVYEVYADDGLSGTIPLEKRPAGLSLLQAARAQRFDQILVYRLDRFGRDTRLILNSVDELEKCGVRVKSMTEEFDTASATGRLLLTMLSGFAAHERDSIRERSMLGTNRLAEAGNWLGGIVPYGYRKVGEKRSAHLMVSEEPIPGQDISEAEAIRRIFRMAAVDQMSCMKISDQLNRWGIPCAYVRDERRVVRGKRKVQTAGIWRPGRVRNLIISTTYKGEHQYGKRAKNKRETITRPVPAIVSPETWAKAQETLATNFLFSKRSAKYQYLLRGLIKCGLCGLTYIGSASSRPSGKNEFYYRCNGAHGSHGLYGPDGKRCRSKAVRGDYIEDLIWRDVERFLRNPGEVLEQLHAKLRAQTSPEIDGAAQLKALTAALADKVTERDRIVSLFRKGRIDEKSLDRQLDELHAEEAALQARIDELGRRALGVDVAQEQMRTAEALLEALRKCLDGPVSWEVKRKLVEALVAGIRVDTVETNGARQNHITVTYRFGGLGNSAGLVLPQEYGATASEPTTIGERLRRKRLSLKLRQKDVAELIGVDTTSVYGWENNRSEPNRVYRPAIEQFLGYDPTAGRAGEITT